MQVLEIYELFRDLATLVDLQQESLDVIENRIIKAKNYTEKAEVELNEAEEYQKKARAVSQPHPHCPLPTAHCPFFARGSRCAPDCSLAADKRRDWRPCAPIWPLLVPT